MPLIEMAIATMLYTTPTDPKIVEEHHCIIEAVAQEAADQSITGRRMVAEVIINRTRDKQRSEGTFCTTVRRKGQFSYQYPRLYRDLTEREINEAAQIVYSYLYDDLEHLLPLDTYSYQNPSIATDGDWYAQYRLVAVEGSHHFLAGRL